MVSLVLILSLSLIIYVISKNIKPTSEVIEGDQTTVIKNGTKKDMKNICVLNKEFFSNILYTKKNQKNIKTNL